MITEDEIKQATADATAEVAAKIKSMSEWDQAVAPIALLPPEDYERSRETLAEKLKVRVSFLDKEVKRVRSILLPTEESDAKQGHALNIVPPEPWPDTVDLAELLDETSAFYDRYVLLPDGAADALACWTVGTHVFECFEVFPRAAVISAEARCGKTTLLDTTSLVVCRPLPASSITTSAIFRTVEIAKPTLLIDEADTFLNNNDEIRGLLNAGNKKGAQVIRCVGDDFEPRGFNVFAPAMVAAIKKVPDTIADRSIIVTMRRALQSERRQRINRKAREHGDALASKAARWAADHSASLTDIEPKMPEHLFNREADNWEPMFAIAGLAGGDWPRRIAAAQRALAGNAVIDDSLGILLLQHLKEIFDTGDEQYPNGYDQMTTEAILDSLCKRDDGPWATLSKGKPIESNKLARMLKPYHIRPRRLGGKTNPGGYFRNDLADTFARFLNRNEPPEAPITLSEPPKGSEAAEAADGGLEGRSRRDFGAADGGNFGGSENDKKASFKAVLGGSGGFKGGISVKREQSPNPAIAPGPDTLERAREIMRKMRSKEEPKMTTPEPEQPHDSKPVPEPARGGIAGRQRCSAAGEPREAPKMLVNGEMWTDTEIELAKAAAGPYRNWRKYLQHRPASASMDAQPPKSGLAEQVKAADARGFAKAGLSRADEDEHVSAPNAEFKARENKADLTWDPTINKYRLATGTTGRS